MDSWFDNLAKDSAHRLSRRQVFGRVAGGLGMAALAIFGYSRLAKAGSCGKLCEECCRNNFPHGGREFAECISACHRGEGICGPIVCPQ